MTTDLDELEHRWNRNEPADVTYVWQFVDELIARLRAAEAAANDPELRRWAVNHIKTRFAQWRTPPVETPADSWIDEIVGEILRRATEYVK